MSGNLIGAAGGTAVAEALKVNTSVLKIKLHGEWCASDGLVSVVVVLTLSLIHISEPTRPY